jgi:hypothetical protein
VADHTWGPPPAPADPLHQEGGPGTRLDHHRDHHRRQPDRRARGTFTLNGAAVCNLRLAVTARVKDGEGWRDRDTSFHRITA